VTAPPDVRQEAERLLKAAGDYHSTPPSYAALVACARSLLAQLAAQEQVPRCETCAHWDVEGEGHWDAHECKLLSQDFCCSGRLVQPHPDTPNDPRSFQSTPPDFPAGATGGGSVETRPHFGCTQWEAR